MSKAGLWPVIARFFWRGDFAGRLDFTNKKFPFPPMDAVGPVVGAANNNQSDNTTTLIQRSDTTLNTDLTAGLVDGARLSIIPTYNGVPLSPRSVFGTAIDVMVLGADFGPNVYCDGDQRPGLQITGARGANGEPLLKYKSLIRAMSVLMSWMVSMNRFGEIDVDVLRNDVVVGNVKIRKRSKAASTS